MLFMPPSPVRDITTCVIALRYAPSALRKATELLASAIGPIRAKSACRACRLSGDVLEPEVLLYEEEWESAAAFRRHVRSEEFWRILVAMDLCTEEPQVTIGDLVAIRGVEYLRTLRSEGMPPSENGQSNANP